MIFDTAVAHILLFEGGYVNNPKDPGGETNRGIAKKFYPDEDIKGMTIERAKEIYRQDYWDKCQCEELPENIRLAVFDCAVNQGVRTAVRLLQQVVQVTPDGVLGPNTLKAIHECGPDYLLNGFIQARLERYKVTANFDVFGRGWLSRLNRVAKDSKADTSNIA